MVYVTKMQSPMYSQMSVEDFLLNDDFQTVLNPNISNTRTVVFSETPRRLYEKVDVGALILKLQTFNSTNDELRKVPRESLYHTFYIPKHSGHGLRRIDAPNTKLMDALKSLRTIFESDFGALYHTSAFAYIKNRSTLNAVKRHQANESRWFAKFDLSNFFGSTTLDFVMQQFSMIFPFSEIVGLESGRTALRDALELAFLNGGLPQGTPISPLITNVMMIPIDFRLTKLLREFEGTKMVYTRYADDFLVSSKYNFNCRKVEQVIKDTLAEFGAPFNLNTEKTRYGSSAGRNWNLGVMLNKDNEITVGYRKKKQFQAMLTNYVLDTQHGHPWQLEDVRVLDGYRNYYKMVEGDTIDRIVKHIGDKFGADIPLLIKRDLRGA